MHKIKKVKIALLLSGQPPSVAPHLIQPSIAKTRKIASRAVRLQICAREWISILRAFDTIHTKKHHLRRRLLARTPITARTVDIVPNSSINSFDSITSLYPCRTSPYTAITLLDPTSPLRHSTLYCITNTTPCHAPPYSTFTKQNLTFTILYKTSPYLYDTAHHPYPYATLLDKTKTKPYFTLPIRHSNELHHYATLPDATEHYHDITPLHITFTPQHSTPPLRNITLQHHTSPLRNKTARHNASPLRDFFPNKPPLAAVPPLEHTF